MKTKFITSTDKLLVDGYEFYIANKGRTDTALSVFWSLYAEELGFYTTLEGANRLEIIFGGSRSVRIKNFCDTPRTAGKVIKVADFGNPSFCMTVRGHLPNGIRRLRPVILTKDKLAMNLDMETLNHIRDICLNFYDSAYDYIIARGLILAEAKFQFSFDEYGSLYLTGEILTPNKAIYWSFSELNRVSAVLGACPMPFHSQPALAFIEECKMGKASYNAEAVSKIQDQIADNYTSLYQRLVGSNRNH